MGDCRWVKFEVNMYDDTKLKIIDDMDNRDLYHYIWTRSLVLAGKINCGGYLYITNNMPYTIKTLAIELNRTIEEVKASFNVLKKLEMIEFTKDKVFKIKNWERHQNVEGLERLRQLNNERVAKHRAKKKEDRVNIDILEMAEDNNGNSYNIDNKVEKNTSDFAEEVSKEKFNNSNVIENNNINDNCNVTSNFDNSDCNITVMDKIKKEKKTKKEKKKESKSEFANNREDETYDSKEKEINKTQTLSGDFRDGERKETSHDEKVSDFLKNDDSENRNINNQHAAELLMYYEKLTGMCGGLNIGFIKLAIDMHGYQNVKMAINKALEVNKANMTYINGILKNWRREGYPKDDVEVKTNGVRSNRKDNTTDKNEFTGFKPKKPRNLTEAERKGAEENLI